MVVSECTAGPDNGDCCTTTNICPEGGGDCDYDSECEEGLVCKEDACPRYHHHASYNDDCCASTVGIHQHQRQYKQIRRIVTKECVSEN